ncbi:MAG: hypothetical protein K2G03_07525 [Bacilli bacterium]|nr:hypothetical protein [Bacilli bacterium]MDE6142438.1 hypothetical protein [Bacilli bacterium]
MSIIVESKLLRPEHHFVYGENNEARMHLLRELEEKYPLAIDSLMPSITYVSDIGLPKMPIKATLEKYPIDLVCQEYIAYSIAQSLISQILNSKSYEEIAYRSRDLFSLLNNFYFKIDGLTVRDYEELGYLIERVKVSFKEHYESFCRTGEIKSPIITSFSLMTLLENMSVILNNAANNIIILDNQEPINEVCYQAINSLISDIHPSTTSINVATSFDDCESYYTFAGHFINYRDDYQVIDLDGNYKRAQDTLMKKYNMDI